MVAKLKMSSLTSAHATLLKLEPHAESHALPINPQWAGFKIPYFNLDGKTNGFFRFRYLQYQPSSGWLSAATPPEKPLRYTQPKGTGCHVYLPPPVLLGGDKELTWKEIAADVKQSLCITEGELKAACAMAVAGVVTIGLGGVFNWRSSNGELLPELEKFVWEGRQVCLAFDSDRHTNAMVHIACARLAKALLARGAVVTEATTPPAPNGDKQGLDDYIAAHGPEAWGAILINSQDVAASAALHALNLELAVVMETAEIVHLSTGNVYNATQFANVLYRDHKYVEVRAPEEQAEGKEEDKKRRSKDVVKYTAKEWLEWPRRSVVQRLVYAPGLPPRSVTESGDYNTWAGWGVEPSKSGGIEPWVDLIEHVFAGADPKHTLWFKRWLAYPLRHPGTKLHSAVLVWGRTQGTGKTLLGETMAEIYGRNYRTINSSDLVSQYNDWVVGHQFIVGDEISVGGSARKITDNLKDIITRTSAVVNLKYRAQYTVQDCNNYYFTSNHAEALFIEDSDRRYFVHEVTAPPLPAPQWTAYTHWLRKQGGAARLFHHLLEELDMGDFDPRAAPPLTQHKQEMIVYNRSDLDAWCAVLKETPDAVLQAAGAVLPYSLFTSADLHKLFDPENTKRYTVNSISRALKKAGVGLAAHGDNSIIVNGARVRLWVVRGSAAKWWQAAPSAAQAAYHEERAKLRLDGGPSKQKGRVM